MPYAPFHEKHPQVAEKETRTIIALNDPELPEDEYTLIEAYCDEPGCDCRRVFFNVYSHRQDTIVAVIAYGWASKKHYAEWFGDNDSNIIKEMQGPVLNSASYQSKLAPALLRTVTKVLKDKRYVDRLKRHYEMFKQTIEAEAPKEHPLIRPAPTKRIARNAPCPCGSGKKYKKCCGRPRRAKTRKVEE